MQRLILTIFILFFLLSCSKRKPEGILSEKEMTEVFKEISLIDGYLSTLGIDSSRKVMPALYNHLFDKYKLDSASFLENLKFYYGNPSLTKKIYTEVAKELSIIDRDLIKKDSIKLAFQNDSINRENRWSVIRAQRERMIKEVHLDTIPYRYNDHNLFFYNLIDLKLHVYGIHTPIISNPTPRTDLPLEEKLPVLDTTALLNNVDSTKQAIKPQTDNGTRVRPSSRVLNKLKQSLPINTQE